MDLSGSFGFLRQHAGRLGAVLSFQLHHDAAHMRLDRALRNSKLIGDLLVLDATAQQIEKIQFPRGEANVAHAGAWLVVKVFLMG